MYFMVQSCLHVAVSFLWLPESNKNIPHLSLVPLSPASIELCENVEIPWKRANSVARLKIMHSMENGGPY